MPRLSLADLRRCIDELAQAAHSAASGGVRVTHLGERPPLQHAGHLLRVAGLSFGKTNALGAATDRLEERQVAVRLLFESSSSVSNDPPRAHDVALETVLGVIEGRSYQHNNVVLQLGQAAAQEVPLDPDETSGGGKGMPRMHDITIPGYAELVG